MTDKGRGWYGDSKRHAEAAKKANEGRLRTAWRSIKGAAGVLANGVRMLGAGARRAGGFFRRQVTGTRRNLGRAWEYLTFDELLPPSIRVGTVIIVIALGSIGVARLIPAVNEEYGEWIAALPIKNDYDLPRWKRD